MLLVDQGRLSVLENVSTAVNAIVPLSSKNIPMVDDPDLSFWFADPGHPVALVTTLVVVGRPILHIVAEVLLRVGEGSNGLIQVDPATRSHKPSIAEVPLAASRIVEEVALIDLVPGDLGIALVALG